MPGMVPTMHEFKQHELRSSSGQLVTNPKQAIAIGLSEQRKLDHAPRRKRRPSIGHAIGAHLNRSS